MRDVIGILSMLKVEDLVPFLVLHLTTSIMVIYVGVKMFGIRFYWCKLLLAAFLYAASMNLIRKVYAFYEIPLGTHTLYLILIKAIIFYGFLKLKVYEALLASVITSLLILSATPLALKIIKALNIDFESFASNPWLFAIIGHVEGIYLMIAVVILAFTKLDLYQVLGRKR